jgi:predicted phage terminase large subunit-like protein
MPPHLGILSRRLHHAAITPGSRLIVTMPPRHGKSELISHWFPVWYLNTFPDRKVILTSYEADFAASWGRKVRNEVMEHADVLNVRVTDDSAAANRWDTTAGGGMITAGAGGPITGKGAHVLIIDDPIKNSEEANSPTVRQKIWDWWQSTAYTRLEPDGIAIVVMTRWNEDDLVGRLLANEDAGEPWQVLNLPAVAEDDDAMGRAPGEALWPGRYTLARLEQIRRAVGQYVWTSLFQQRPKSPEGQYFKRAWFKNRVDPDRVPRDLRRIRAWDLAATAEGENGNRDPDYTVGCLLGESLDGTIYVLDVNRLRKSPREVESALLSTAQRDGHEVAIRIEQEGGSSGKMVGDHITRTVLRGFDARFVKPQGDKFVRSQPFNAACERQDVKLVRGDWNDAFIEELVGFPLGKHDDQVDAAVAAFAGMTSAIDPWDADDFATVFNRMPTEKLTPTQILARLRQRGD